MFLIDTITAQFNLVWSQQKPMVRPLPPHIERTYVQTPGGDLELLVCKPKKFRTSSSSSDDNEDNNKAPIFFAHGGCGTSTVWLEWMTYLHEHNYPSTTYAYSARNHGASYTLPYKQIVHQTPFEDILSDAAYSLDHIAQLQKEESAATAAKITRPPILVGHSSGGGIIQALTHGTHKPSDSTLSLHKQTSGLCLVGAIPSYGSYDMYWNWFKHDPYFPLRSLFHMQHPNSPLSTDELVQRAFFGHLYTRERAAEFRRWMPEYETMGWPMAMLGRKFGEWWGGMPNEWLDERRIVESVVGSGKGGDEDDSDKVCVIVGREDMMYRAEMWERQCREYREALRQVKGANGGKMDKSGSGPGSGLGEPINAVSVEREGGVRLVLVEDSGHHVQNDVHCDEAAEALLRWANQV